LRPRTSGYVLSVDTPSPSLTPRCRRRLGPIWSAVIEVDHPPHRYVSRAGAKLERALDHFGIDVTGLVCLDAGASTGGFTDCLLTRGAARVYAVDVGYGLLAWKLRTDERVVVLDRTNARYLEPEGFRRAVEERGREFIQPTFATCDLSFISLLKVVPAVHSVLASPWQMVLLVKPQFEAGREKVGAKGVVRDPEVHVEVLQRVAEGLTGSGLVPGAGVAGLTYSPVRGPEGNLEYLLWLVERGGAPLVAGSPDLSGPPLSPGPEEIRRVVAEAFAMVPRASG